jgi:GMP synthase-like glutamine amidotransferase
VIVKALFIQHDHVSPVGPVGQRLAHHGFEIETQLVVPEDKFESPNVPFEFPNIENYDLIIPLGAPWGAWDDECIGNWLQPELAWIKNAVESGKPVLGICGGQQLLAVALGGQLIQHIPDEVPGALAHEQPNPRTEPGHEVAITEGSMLSRIIGKPRMAVNSAHHQAVASIGDGGVVNALAPDGVIEGIEHPGYRFALGVQWHPEYAVDPDDPAIFRAFIAACRA